MSRLIGTTARGLRAPIIKEGDNLSEIVVNSVVNAIEAEGIKINDKDVIGVTESLVARAQGNYISIQNISEDIKAKFDGEIAVMFPILSRNRFSLILKSIALSGRKLHLFLNYPSDEVGNHLMDIDLMDSKGVNPYTDVLTEAKYRELFGEKVEHPFTGIDYVQMYRDIVEEVGGEVEIYLANDPREALKYTDQILVANIHERHRTKRIMKAAGAKVVYGLDDIASTSINGSGYSEFGLLGSNKATDETIKLFPREGDAFVRKVQAALNDKIGKNVEVMIYGDGAFKDPVGKIWELADPIVSPGFTDGLVGTPNEIKLKYVADNELKDVDSASIADEMKKKIMEKENKKVAGNEALGTTPRQITDLLGSLCDLVSGSGDKGTPIILIQGYFDNFATE
ncbi:MAG: coenzyme F420-0:L-glutamate ligase [Clostridium sp.]